MHASRTLAQETAEDLFFGQIVIIWARWFLIAAGTVLALIATQTPTEVTLTILVVVIWMASNFFLHARYLLEKPANRLLLLGIVFVDSLLISSIVELWPGRSGAQSQFFVLYYPLLLAFALVFPPVLTAAYTIFTLSLYLGACFIANPWFIDSLSSFEVLFVRMLTLAAMSGLGTFYWRIQREHARPKETPAKPRLRPLP